MNGISITERQAGVSAAPHTHCSACGMLVGPPPTYHPYAACLMFRAARNLGPGAAARHVDANLRAVVEYGMKAQQLGVPLDVAMKDLTRVR